MQGSDDLPAAFADAAEGRIDVVVDPLFGEPFAAAVEAASFGARIVQVGAGAGAESDGLLGADPRQDAGDHGPHELRRPAGRQARRPTRSLSALAASGELKVETEPIELERVAEAWELLQAGSHRKILLVPPARR